MGLSPPNLMTDEEGVAGLGGGGVFFQNCHRGRRRREWAITSKGGQAEGELRGEAVRDVSLYLDPMFVHAGLKFEGSDAMCVSGPVGVLV